MEKGLKGLLLFNCLTREVAPFVSPVSKKGKRRKNKLSKRQKKANKLQLKQFRKTKKKKGKRVCLSHCLSQEPKKLTNWLKVDYYEYINSDKWIARRELYYKTNQKKCICCDSTTNLNLHHITYDSLGDELDKDLAPMCKKCHKEFHRTHKHNDKLGLLRFARNIRLSR